MSTRKRRSHWWACQKCGGFRATRTDVSPRATCRICRASDYHYVGFRKDQYEAPPAPPPPVVVKEPVRVHIRWSIRRDMPEVFAIEAACFEFPWTEEDFLRCLRERNCIGMVAEVGETVVGYMLYELHKSRLHVLNFAVHHKWRRRRVGVQMVNKLVSKLSSHRRTRITLEVREANLPAQLFFGGQGFRAVRVLRGFYGDSGEDAYRMEYRFASGAPGGDEEAVNRVAQYEEN